MTPFGIVMTALLVVVGTGAYRVFLWLSEQLCKLLPANKASRAAFVAVVVVMAATSYPFITPTHFAVQAGVWVLYLGFAGIGAWHIWDWAQTLRNTSK